MKNKNLLEFLLIIFLAFTVALVSVQIFSRYILHSSLSYTDELVRYMFIWIVFWGIVFAQEHGEHIAFEFSLFSGRIQKRLRQWSITIYFVIFFYLGVKLVIFQIETAQRSAVLRMPMFIVTAALPLSVVYLFFRVMRKR